jgi:replicative DNA helicase
MSTRQLGARFLAQEAHVSVFHILSGKLWGGPDRAVRQAAMRLAPLPIYYEETGVMTMDSLRAKARQLRVKGQLDILFIDYLQLMQGSKRRDSRQVEVSEISRGLKLLAKELEITVIAMSQLSRNCEGREDKRPILSDLRESGAIEQDADIVIGLYRDAVYHKETPEPNVAEILIRKHRNGPIGDVLVAFTEESARFSDMVTA